MTRGARAPNGLPSLLLLAGALLLAPAVATAQTDEELAKRYYKLGEVLYDRSEYEGALEQFRRAYAHANKPALLYNMARCRESLGQHEEAIALYRRYLAAKPANAEVIKARINNLERLVAKKKEGAGADAATAATPRSGATPPPDSAAAGGAPPTEAAGSSVAAAAPDATAETGAPAGAGPAPDRSDRARPLRLTGWVLAGTGVALVGTGVAMGLWARSRESDLERANEQGEEFADHADALDQGETLERVAIASYVVGGAAAVAGAVLVFLDWRAERQRRQAWVGPTLTAGGAGLYGRFTF